MRNRSAGIIDGGGTPGCCGGGGAAGGGGGGGVPEGGGGGGGGVVVMGAHPSPGATMMRAPRRRAGRPPRVDCRRVQWLRPAGVPPGPNHPGPGSPPHRRRRGGVPPPPP